MYELIAFRGLQGIGGGGLIALVFAIVGDVIPPRQRGRYQGYFGATFALASVDRPAGRRLLRRQPVVALHLLHQPAARHRHAGRRQPGPAAARPGPRGPHRLVGRAADRLRESRRSCSAPSPAATTSPGRRGRSSACSPLGAVFIAGFVVREHLRARTDPAARAVPRPHLHAGQHRRVRQRYRDVRRAGLPAAVPAARPRRLGDPVGPAAAADAGRDRCRPASAPAATSAAPGATAGSRWPAPSC